MATLPATTSSFASIMMLVYFGGVTFGLATGRRGREDDMDDRTSHDMIYELLAEMVHDEINGQWD
jgi:hypothetical protein